LTERKKRFCVVGRKRAGHPLVEKGKNQEKNRCPLKKRRRRPGSRGGEAALLRNNKGKRNAKKGGKKELRFFPRGKKKKLPRRPGRRRGKRRSASREKTLSHFVNRGRVTRPPERGGGGIGTKRRLRPFPKKKTRCTSSAMKVRPREDPSLKGGDSYYSDGRSRIAQRILQKAGQDPGGNSSLHHNKESDRYPVREKAPGAARRKSSRGSRKKAVAVRT